MRGKQGFRQVRNRDGRVIFAGFDATTSNVVVNSATPNSLNGTDPATIFSGFQNIALPQNTPTSNAPTIRLAATNNRFALLSYSSDTPGYTPTASQIFISRDAKKWLTKTLPTRNTADSLKHAWAAVYGSNGRIIVSHAHYPDVVIADNSIEWTLLQNVFAVNGFQQNGITAGNGMLLAAADNAKVIYRSLDNGITWTAIASNILIDESSGSPRLKALDSVLALTYGALGASNVFFMLAQRNDVTRYRYVLTSTDGVTWTQRFRVDRGTTGSPQEPIMASAPNRTVIVLNNLTTATTFITTTTGTWTQVTSTPAANWRSVTYDGSKFVAAGEPFGSAAAPVVMTLNPAVGTPTWAVKLTDTQKLRAVVSGSSVQPQISKPVALLLQMADPVGSATFTDASLTPKTVTASNVLVSDAQSKWPEKYSAPFSAPWSSTYLEITRTSDLVMGTGDFTIEAWLWLNTYGAGYPSEHSGNGGAIWESRTGNLWDGFMWGMSGSGALLVRLDSWASGLGTILYTEPAVLPLQTWTHVALVRKNNETVVYVDGQSKGSARATFNDTPAATKVYIGRDIQSDYFGLDGYIGEFRVINGVAQYVGNSFSVPQAPLLNYVPLNAPTNVAVESGNKELFVGWMPPSSTDNLLIVGYVVEMSNDGGTTWAAVGPELSTATTKTIANLTNGAEYLFRVAAVTEDGVGPYSSVSAPVIVGGDQHFDKVSLLLQFETASSEDYVAGTIDSSGYKHVANTIPTANWPRFTGTSNPYNLAKKFGGSVWFKTEYDPYFGSDGPIPYVKFSNNAAFNLSSVDWTVEAWLWSDGRYDVPNTFIAKRDGSTDWELYLRPGDGGLSYFNGQNYETSNAPVVSQWNHVAAVKAGNVLSLYLNGRRVLAVNNVGANQGTDPLYIGTWSGERFSGLLDEVRVTNGVARYQGGGFALPAFSFPVDGPLKAPIQLIGSPANQRVELSWQPPRSKGFSALVGYSVQYSADAGATWTTFPTGGSTATTAAVTGLTNEASYLFRVAAMNADGIGPYAVTTAITPTNGDPLFNSVSLLLRFNETTGTFVDASPRPKLITQNGSPTAFSTISKWGDGSALFSGGWLKTPTHTDFSFGTGDFTIEFWAYPTVQTQYGAMVNVGYYNDGILFRQRIGWPFDALYLNNSYANWNSQTNMPLNVWTHMALVREAGVVAVYANGTRVLTWNNAANLNPSGTFVTIGTGVHSPTSWGEAFIGHLDDLRITKGVARYSGPTATIPTGPVLGAPE